MMCARGFFKSFRRLSREKASKSKQQRKTSKRGYKQYTVNIIPNLTKKAARNGERVGRGGIGPLPQTQFTASIRRRGDSMDC